MKSRLLITFHLNYALLDCISCKLSTRLNLISACTAAYNIYKPDLKSLMGLHMAKIKIKKESCWPKYI